MLLSECTAFLKQKNLIVQECTADNRELKRPVLITDTQDQWSRDSLYIGSIRRHHKPDVPIVLVTDTMPDFPLPEGSAVLLICSGGLREAGNELFECFSLEWRHETDFSALMCKLLEPVSLAEAVDDAAAFFDRSLVLTDLSFQVVDASRRNPITDTLWKNNVQRGYCTHDFIEAVNDLLQRIEVPCDTTAFPVECYASKEGKLCSKLFVGNKHTGYLIMLDNNKEFLPFHGRYLSRMSWLIAQCLQKLPVSNNFFGNLHESILRGLLNENSAKTAKQRALAASIRIPASMRCLYICPKYLSDADSVYLANCISSIFPDILAAPFNDTVIVLMDADDAKSLEKNKEFCSYLNHVKMIGISNPFADLLELKKRFKQAKTACTIGTKLHNERKIYYYDDYQFYDLLLALPDSGIIKEYIHPALMQLKRYDEENGTELFSTLYTYVSHGCNNKETAAALFLHRNTLTYRIARISELTGLDLTSPKIQFRLMCSYMIFQIYGDQEKV